MLAAIAPRCIGQRRVGRFGQGNEFGQVFDRQLGVECQNKLIRPQGGHRDQFFVHVHSGAGIQIGVDGQQTVHAHQQGVAIRRSSGHVFGSGLAVGANFVLNHHRLPHLRGQLGPQSTGNHVGCAARGDGRDQSNRALRVGLCRDGVQCR